MNENLQQALADVLIAATETAGQAKDFVLAELPDVVQQLLMWKMTVSLLWFAVWMLLALASYFVYRRAAMWHQRTPKLSEEQTARLADLQARGFYRRSCSEDREVNALRGKIAVGWLRFIPLATGVFFVMVGLANCMDWLQILIAPKVYLIEYAASLVK